jgi:glycosyltransferase involved in cell wall biosynthesis
MRITALVKSHDHVCCRYRIAAFRPYFQCAGYDLAVRPWSSRWLLQQMFPSFLDDMDVLIVQRKLFPSWQLNLLRQRVRWLIYDFDDAIFLNSSYSPAGLDSPKRQHQFKEIVDHADIVAAGNEFLHEQATVITDPAKVHRIPTCLDVARYRLARHSEAREKVKLAWIGSASTLRGLEKIRDLLDHLGKRLSRLELKVICDRSLRLDRLRVDFRRWSEATECAELADADIGISWLPTDWWSEGKCGLKVLQYMAAGLPVIANPVGLHKQLIRHGETGFLVETRDEWEEAVRLLARDPDLRRQMGRAGRSLVESEYDVRVGASAWLNVLQTLTERTCDLAALK